ncbi:MAG TPA: MauE/DoxX family redox-associated membrane protein [Rubrobacteraceae bacterium]|nr:MauE/DoxX family redox-associated membrane protein [Rubrobacteraceae bacterium]
MDAGPSFSRTLLGLIFIVAGALHFRAPDAYEQIVPPYLPLHRELVYLSGALEIAGGLGLLAERTRRGAGIGLILLLVAVWPANAQMLLDARAAEKPVWWVALLWARLPLQLVLIAWVWRVSRPRS